MQKIKKKVFFRNTLIDKNSLVEIMSWSFENFGMARASFLSDSLKKIGFEYVTKAGISLNIEDLKVPPLKNFFILDMHKKTKDYFVKCSKGEITEGERFQHFLSSWTNASEYIKNDIISHLKSFEPLNPIFITAFSGARGNISQIKQLIGIRGLMSNPSGGIIDTPITKNFREGLTVTDYMISAYGARKGVVDTALKTADSGYLTRRLIDVAQDVLIKENDCFSKQGILLFNLDDGKGNKIILKNRLLGRVLAKNIFDQEKNFTLGLRNQQINSFLSKKIEENNINKIFVRSPLTCKLTRSICKNCYGWNLSRGKLVDLGEAIGIIAAHSIGEPGTQLTMRTFHTGGTYNSKLISNISPKFSGKIIVANNLRNVKFRTDEGVEGILLDKLTKIDLINFKNQKSTFFLETNTILFVKNNQYVKKNHKISIAYQKDYTEKEKKNVISKISGEIFLEPNYTYNNNNTEKTKNEIIWILSGKVFNIPLDAKINKTQLSNLIPIKTIASSKLINNKNGFLDIFTKKDNNLLANIYVNLLIKNFKLKNYLVFQSFFEKKVKKENLIILFFSKNKYFWLKKTSKIKKDFLIFADLINNNFRTNVDGKIYLIRLKKNLSTIRAGKYNLHEGGTIFFLQQEKFLSFKKELSPNIILRNWLNKNTVIFNKRNKINKNSGFLILIKLGLQVLLTLKSCSYIKLKINKKIINFRVDKKLVFSGEKIFNRIIIKNLISIKLFRDLEKKIVFLLFRPGFLYELGKAKTEKKVLSKKPTKNFDVINFLNLKNRQRIKLINKKKSFDLIKTQLIFIKSENIIKKPIYNFLLKKNKEYSFTLTISENILDINNIEKILDFAELKISFLGENLQYIESYSIIANLEFLPKIKKYLSILKEKKYFSYKKLILISNEDYVILHSENKNLIYKKVCFLKSGDLISKNLILSDCGFIENNTSNLISIRIAKPFLFSKAASTYYVNNDFIQENDILGITFYKIAQTGDIVQGLPKIEEILEARKTQLKIKSFKDPHFFLFIKQIKVIKMNKEKTFNIFFAVNKFGLQIDKFESKKIFINHENFLNVGRPANNNFSNPHYELIYLNEYFKEFLDPYKAAYRTLKKIQYQILNIIQIIYSSQNVIISDKHVEIIIKKMTSKVIILSKGDSDLSTGQYIDLVSANSINKILSRTKSKKILYRPVLFGITKASLTTKSFISSASFQQTIKVLTHAAIQGKVDWLKGLKENVIVGRLIPAGTGFNSYEDISHLNVRILKKNKY